MNSKFIVNLQGKDYPTYPGILDEAHTQGLTSIETELIQAPNTDNDQVAIVKATVKLGEKVFIDYGDASPKNVNSRIATALIRMASTRAKGRALRDAVNVGDTMLEELPQDEAKVSETHNVPQETLSPRISQNMPSQTPSSSPADLMRQGMEEEKSKQVTTPYCPVHETPAKLVPAGVSKTSGKPYQAFYACTTRGCKEKPVMGIGAELNVEDIPF